MIFCSVHHFCGDLPVLYCGLSEAWPADLPAIVSADPCSFFAHLLGITAPKPVPPAPVSIRGRIDALRPNRMKALLTALPWQEVGS